MFTPRPLFDGIMFLTACDDDFILKCEWIHISDENICGMFTCRKRKYTTSHDSLTQVCRTLSCVHRKKLFEVLKYYNICKLYCNFNWINFQIMRVIHKICTNLRNGENDVTFIVQLKMKHVRFEWMTFHKPKYAKSSPQIE